MRRCIYFGFILILLGIPKALTHSLSNHGFHCEKIINRECKFSGEWDKFTRSVPNCNPRQSRGRIGFEILSCKCNYDDHEHK